MLSGIRFNKPNNQNQQSDKLQTSIVTASSTSSLPQYVAKITVEIPSHKIETTDFNVGNEIDIEKMGLERPNTDHRDNIPPYTPRSIHEHESNSHDSIIGWSFEPITSIDDEDNDKQSFSHRVFDLITRHAGSRYILLVTIILLILWVMAGAIFGPSDIWQIAMQNASSVQVYLTDILLIRQQHTSSRHLLTILSKMQSKDRTYTRLIQKLPSLQEPSSKFQNSTISESSEIASLADLVPGEIDSSRSKRLFDESCRVIAGGLGSIWSYCLYWICILIWIGFGKSLDFNDTWQLYINTAVAVALTFTSIFLQNRQQQQEDTLDGALKYISKVDWEIEFRLRKVTEDEQVNDIVVIETPKVGWINRGNDWFALMMGSFVGVIITVIFLVVWGIFGPILQYSPNWWLILGTFTGLLGFLDGFVLRNVYAREADIVNRELQKSMAANSKVLSHLGLHCEEEEEKKLSLSSRVSRTVGDWTASPSVSLASLLFIIALLAAATLMRWTTTAQLLCNTPTMIIEGFLLLVLIEAHCIADEIKGRQLKGILQRRLLFNQYLRESMMEIEKGEEKS